MSIGIQQFVYRELFGTGNARTHNIHEKRGEIKDSQLEESIPLH